MSNYSLTKKVKIAAIKYGYKLVYVQNNYPYGLEYKFCKDYYQQKILIYIKFNDDETLQTKFFLIETDSKTISEAFINVLNAIKEQTNKELDSIAREVLENGK